MKRPDAPEIAETVVITALLYTVVLPVAVVWDLWDGIRRKI